MQLWLTLELIITMPCGKMKRLSIRESDMSFVQHNFNNDSGETVTTNGKSASFYVSW